MKRHILLIDDDSEELDIFCNALTEAGIDHKCTWAQGVKHALKMLEYLRPDVIFIDHNMPSINGVEGIAMIRSNEAFKNAPIVLYSNSITDISSSDALEGGATACLRKPFYMGELVEKLRNYFSVLVLEHSS